MIVVRWVIALLSPVLALVLTFATAVLLTYALERVCPPDLMVSGVCTAPWYPPAELASFCVAAALGGLVFVLLPSGLAPGHTKLVAWVALGAGVTYSTLFLWHAGASLLGPCVSALAGGLAAIYWAHRRAANAA